ncbi:DUF2947 family protein [Microbulbifer sp. ZKSA004]|uniref:DUF2947 family protein n=1 Tax=Microbulbifer sp. ZKSA004 TaxID=3243389 RepID=UPI004039E6ED
MDAKLIPVEISDFREYFEGSGQEIYLLAEDSAADVWEKNIDPKASSYFSLPDHSWIVDGKLTLLGNWLEPFNAGEKKDISSLMKDNFQWSDECTVGYFIKKKLVFQTTWLKFRENWDDFLSIEDDCCLLCPIDEDFEEAILFRAIGDFLKIDKFI